MVGGASYGALSGGRLCSCCPRRSGRNCRFVGCLFARFICIAILDGQMILNAQTRTPRDSWVLIHLQRLAILGQVFALIMVQVDMLVQSYTACR